MIVWLNGTFGVGKTTTSSHLTCDEDRLRPFDPEWVGYMLANNLQDHEVTDFQHYPSWRRLVPVVANESVQVTGQHLVAAQSVLVEDYWLQIRVGLTEMGHDVFHVLLDADAETLHARIDSDATRSLSAFARGGTSTSRSTNPHFRGSVEPPTSWSTL